MPKEFTETRRADTREDRYAKMGASEKSVLKDGTQSDYVFSIPTDTEKYDLGRMRYHSVGTKGYAQEAFKYDY